MKTLRTPRFWLLTTAALMLGAHGTANAQTASSYNYGTPTMVAAAPGLPSVPAEQIARDVTREVNPRSGQMELAAAPFDPFEDDPNLAGALQLRSADGGLSIDGQPLQGGAIVDVSFYYNSPSDDPFGGRNYGDASFVNGQLAPIVTRDSRVLECSTRVENVVYDHSNYYARSPHLGIYRPYRHYIGHSGFGFGFGSSYFGPGFGFYNSNRRNFRSIRRFGSPRVVRGYRSDNRDGRRDRRADRDRYRDHDGDRDRRRDHEGERDRRRDHDSDRDRDRDRDRDGRRGEDRADREDRSETRQGLTSRQRENRLRALEAYGSAMPWSGSTRSSRRSTLRSATPQPRIAIGSSRTSIQSGTPKIPPQISQSDLKNPERRSQARRGAETRTGRVGNTSRRVTTNRDLSSRVNTRSAGTQAPRSTSIRSSAAPSRAVISRPSGSSQPSPRSSGPKSSSSSGTIKTRASSSRPSSRSAPSRASSRSTSSSRSSSSSGRSKPSRSSSSRNTKSRQLNFFPNRTQGGRQVVTSQSVDCAREDVLRVFVPNDRLDAARFDGLTLIALDAQGGETPIYIPPNYIEGFRLASSGRIQPQGYQQPGIQQSQGYQSPQPYAVTPAPTYPQSSYPRSSGRIEVAPCPAGTTKQPDGTCLQASYSAYPTR